MFPVESAPSRHSPNHHAAIVGAAIIRAIRRTRLEARQHPQKDYEGAHERVLQIFNKDYKPPASFKVHQFVVQFGDYGGYIIVETDSPADIHFFTSTFAVFEFKVEPVVDVMDAVTVELKAIEYPRKTSPKRRQ